MEDKLRLYIIDGTSIVYRAFHAIPDLRNSKGLPTNAVYGFISTLKKNRPLNISTKINPSLFYFTTLTKRVSKIILSTMSCTPLL